MKVAIIKERRAHERRVAASPDTVKHMAGMGLQAVVESGAGGDAYFPEFSEQEWAIEKREDYPRFEFVVYRRKGARPAVS